MEQFSYGPLIMSIKLKMSCYIGFFNVRISQHRTSVLRIIRRTNLRDQTLRKFMWPDFAQIYATWHPLDNYDLSLDNFVQSHLVRIKIYPVDKYDRQLKLH